MLSTNFQPFVCMQELGSSEIFPSSVQHNANGRFVAVCGDGEYVVYTALAWRNKSFGTAAEFAWSCQPNDFATRDPSSSVISLHKNFKVCTHLLTCAEPDL